jgi:DNA polymerase-3 subunit epsilon
MYAIVDIETTGGSPVYEKITEIAIYIHDGLKVIDEFHSLIHPERIIPHFITQLTGITNEMVADAPKFYEIAKELVEITDGKIFVAHNVSFDYNFVYNEFKQLGYHFQRKQLCTVKLSRKLLPGQPSYSLGNLCHSLSIEITDRHRASGDAMATVKLFEHLLQVNQLDHQNVLTDATLLSTKGLHHKFDRNQLEKIPDEPGVYYFHNENGDIIYIGKSKKMHQRIMSHFYNRSTKKALEMKSNIAHISYEITGNELIALLLESEEIKKHKPLYNRAQRRTLYHYGLFPYFNEGGYVCFKVERITGLNNTAAYTYNSKKEAKQHVSALIQKFNLCQNLCGFEVTAGGCFYHRLGECEGACVGIEPVSSYNRKASNALKTLRFLMGNCYIFDRGREGEEKSVVKIENGRYCGFGYFNPRFVNATIQEEIDDCIKVYQDNHDVHQIIQMYVRKHKVENIVQY